jgi:hypothetical protein
MPRQQAVRAAHPAVSVASIEEIADRLAPLPLFARLDREAQLAIAA